ncbi:heme peroxidase [Mycena haematopus]|nr:heme peroxidase [Mycena haematopus]
MLFRLVLGAVAVLATVDAYIWPSPQLDALEAVRFDQFGFTTLGTSLSTFITPCNLFAFGTTAGGANSGRSDAADWIRTAYHDVATYNSTDGTGGLDASIRFAEEQARAENTGNGFANTLGVVFAEVNRYVSMADTIALGAVIAIENCGGPEIAFRGGRIDAAESNAPGVPQPEQSLDSHIAAFSRQGFTQTEMIGLVACGHTFGGVQHGFFPDIVDELNLPTDTEDVAHFDSTFVHFDNNIATEYISGATQNPLVIGFNDTTNSDRRIFGSDGNQTMLSFANSLDHFTSTCADLYARMLDTVPSGVQLTEVIEPLPVKPANVKLTLDGDTLQLWGILRLWNTTADPTRTVQVVWQDHYGGSGNSSLTFVGTSSSTGGKYSATWYWFNPTLRFGSITGLNATAGVKSLSFVVDGKVEDQGGVGFAVQDGFMLAQTSCSTGAPEVGRVDVAVRNGVNVTRVYLEKIGTDSVHRVVITEIDIPRPSPGEGVAPNSGPYWVWSMNLTDQSMQFTIGAEIDGVKPLLLGTWGASIIFGVVLSEAYKYFVSFPTDSWRRKGLVVVVLTFGSIALIGDYANTYLPVVTFWGDSEAVQKTYWPLPLYSIVNTLLAIVVDCYLVQRFYALSKNIWATMFLYAVLLLALAGYIVRFIPLVQVSSLTVQTNAKVGATISFICVVVADMLTAAGLIWKLRSMRSSFAQTNSLVNRVMLGALQTGSATSLCSILLLVTFLKNPESNVPTFFIFLFAPLYSLTLLLNFNIRQSTGPSSTNKTSESRGGANTILMDGIQIHRTAIVTMDPTDAELAAARRKRENNRIKRDLDTDAESLGAQKVDLQP